MILRLKKGQTNSGSFKKGHKQSEASRKKMSLALKGKPSRMKGKKHTPKSLQKMSKTWFVKGQTSWNKGKKGVMPEPWNKGKTGIYSREQLQKMSKSQKQKYADGYQVWNKGKKGVMPEPWNKGKKASPELRKKLSESHKGQTAWNKGKTGVYSREHLQKMSIARKGVKYAPGRFSAMKGKKQTKEARRKISIANKGKTVTEITRSKIGKANTGKKASEETKRKQSLSHLGHKAWNKNTTDTEYIEKMRKKRLHEVFPFKDTKIEKILQNGLKENGIKFQKHKPILGQPDLFIEPNVCIFADGDYWHGYLLMQGKDFSRQKVFNNKYFKSRIQKDKKVTGQLKKEGYNVLRFWEHEIKENPEKCIQKIIKAIK